MTVFKGKSQVPCGLFHFWGAGDYGPFSLTVQSLHLEVQLGQPCGQFTGDKAGSLPLDSGLRHVLHNLSEALDLGS